MLNFRQKVGVLMSIKIFPVLSKRELKKFIMMPWIIYRNDPNWVPPLISEQKKILNKGRFAFFEHSEADFFLAEKDGQIVGRIAAINNRNHLKVYSDDTGFFGFFECINNQAVADALFEQAASWVKARGLKYLRGPESYSQNEEAGLLVDGFESPPVIMMTYNPRWYVNLIETYGFQKKMDLYAYRIHQVTQIPGMLKDAVAQLQQTADFTVRKINMCKLDQEVEGIKEIYNAAWSENWGAVPLTEREMEALKHQLKQIVIDDLILIAEINGEPVGISITIPDVNEALIHVDGRLFPFGLFRLLWYNRKIKGLRTLIMGVKKEHRHKGIDKVFYYETFKNGLSRGFEKCEMSWILENNVPMRTVLEKIYGSHIYKTYRLYEKPI
jgi:hypothetical protein